MSKETVINNLLFKGRHGRRQQHVKHDVINSELPVLLLKQFVPASVATIHEQICIFVEISIYMAPQQISSHHKQISYMLITMQDNHKQVIFVLGVTLCV